MNYPGTLIVRPVCAKLLRDTDFISRMDPYCEIVLGGQRQRTATASEAGKSPVWHDSLVFKRTVEDMIQIRVFDYDTNSRDDLIAEGNVPVARVLSVPSWEDWVELFFRGKKAGDIRIGLSFMVDPAYAGTGYAQPYQSANVYGGQYAPPPVYMPPQGYADPMGYSAPPLYQQPPPMYQQPPPMYQGPPPPAYPPGYTYPDPNYPGYSNPEAHLHQPGCPHRY